MRKRFVGIIVIGILSPLLLMSGNVMADEMKVLPPEKGMYHSTFPDLPDEASPSIISKMTDEFEKLTGKEVVWVIIGNDWVKGIKFPEAEVWGIQSEGKIPLVRMMPWSKKVRNKGTDPVYALDNFLAGKFDSKIRAWAKAAKATGRPVMVEFAPEANGSWFPWNGLWNGGAIATEYGNPNLPDGPEKYRDTFRHIVSLFREEGADNVTWVFHVDAQPQPQEPWNSMKNYYPGDEYVDWIGLSVFGAIEPAGDWYPDFTQVLDWSWDEIKVMTSTKPIAVVESATIEHPQKPLAKAAWIKNALTALKSGKYPEIKAFTWWHEIGWLDWANNNLRTDSSVETLRSYRENIADPFFVSDARISGAQSNTDITVDDRFDMFKATLNDVADAKDIFDRITDETVKGLTVIKSGTRTTKEFVYKSTVDNGSGKQTLKFKCWEDTASAPTTNGCMLTADKISKSSVPYKSQVSSVPSYWIVRNDNEYSDSAKVIFNIFKGYTSRKVQAGRDSDVNVRVPAGIEFSVPERQDSALQVVCRGQQGGTNGDYFCKFRIKMPNR